MGAEQGKNIDRRSFLKGPLKYLKEVTSPISDKDFSRPEDSPETHLGRRSFFHASLNEASSPITSIGADSFDLMQDIINGLANKAFGRKKFVIGAFCFTFVGGAIYKIFQDNPNLAQDAKIRYELNDVWDEVLELQNPPTHQELLDHVYNAFKPIELTGEELDNAAIVTIEDSEGVVDGNRENSLGPDQPGSWPLLVAAKLTDGLRKLGRLGKVLAFNFAQPGASTGGTVGFEDPQGNVQLGAKTIEDMATDHPGELPPTYVMENHKGFLIAAYGVNGDDMRDTADALLKYINPESKHYSAKFVDFLQHPSKEKLENDDEILAMTKEVLISYKGDKIRIKTKFGVALDDYKKIFNYREEHEMGRGVLVVSQPDALDEYPTMPYVKLGSKRGTKGALDMKKYGDIGRIAALWTMAPFYYIQGPMLKDFGDSTGIPVTSTPILAWKIPKSHLSEFDSHFGPLAHEDRANNFVQLIHASDGDNNLVFGKNGESRLIAA